MRDVVGESRRAEDRTVSHVDKRSLKLGHSLRSPSFRALFLSTLISSLGASISLVSVNWIVYHYTQSSLDIAYLGLTGIIPGVALGLFSGVAADRYNRRSLMVGADLARFTLMGLLTGILFLQGFSLIAILLVMVSINSFSSLFTPASQAIVASLVPKSSLEDATGLLWSGSSAMYSVGSAIGGFLVALLGAVWGLGTNALTYLLSAMFLIQIAAGLGTPRKDSPRPEKSVGADFVEGMNYVRRHRLIAITFGYLPVNLLSSLVGPFIVVYSATRFNGSALVYGSLAAALAAGTAGGPLVVGRLQTRHIAGVLMGIGIMWEGSMYVIVGLTGNIVMAILSVFGAGFVIGFSNTIYYSTMQATVPKELLGRVLSVGDFGSFVAIPAGLVVGGLLIAQIGVEREYLLAAVGMIVCAAILLAVPSFRAFGRVEDFSTGSPTG